MERMKPDQKQIYFLSGARPGCLQAWRHHAAWGAPTRLRLLQKAANLRGCLHVLRDQGIHKLHVAAGTLCLHAPSRMPGAFPCKEGSSDAHAPCTALAAGGSLEELQGSVFVEKLLQKGYEVLYLTEPVDEYMMTHLTEFDDRKFQDASKDDVKLGKDDKKAFKALKARCCCGC